MADNKKTPKNTPIAVKNMQDLAKSTASGMQSLAKKTAKGAQSIAKSTAESVKRAQIKKEIIKESGGSQKSQKPVKKKVKKKTKRTGINLKFLGGALLRKMAKGGALQLGSNAEEVNKLNVFPVPDGDTGDNMRMTIESGIAAIENIDSDDLAEVMKPSLTACFSARAEIRALFFPSSSREPQKDLKKRKKPTQPPSDTRFR